MATMALEPVEPLPPELLTEILSYLNRTPSQTWLYEHPDRAVPNSLSTDERDLKAASCVCKKWRRCSLDQLFAHVRWYLDLQDLALVDPGQGPASMPLPAFLQRNGLGQSVQTFTVVVGDGDNGPYLVGRHHGPLGSTSSPDSTANGGRRPMFSSLRAGCSTATSSMTTKTLAEQHNWLWSMLFALTDPLRFTIIATPRILVSFTSRMLFLGDLLEISSQCPQSCPQVY